jgi:putative thiamine transport system ATP-binding protein
VNVDQKGLTIDHLHLCQGERTLLRLDSWVAPGEILSVMGPSGSGKSSLLHWIAGALPFGLSATGQCGLDGQRIDQKAPHQRQIGLMFQDALLFPHLSVGDNIMLAVPSEVKGYKRRRDTVMMMLDTMQMGEFYHRHPSTLSGGQAMRVALARTLAARPKALLLDEPFSGLDTHLKQAIRELVFSTCRDRGLPGILVTHDEEDAKAAGGAIVTIGQDL